VFSFLLYLERGVLLVPDYSPVTFTLGMALHNHRRLSVQSPW